MTKCLVVSIFIVFLYCGFGDQLSVAKKKPRFKSYPAEQHLAQVPAQDPVATGTVELRAGMRNDQHVVTE